MIDFVNSFYGNFGILQEKWYYNMFWRKYTNTNVIKIEKSFGRKWHQNDNSLPDIVILMAFVV